MDTGLHIGEVLLAFCGLAGGILGAWVGVQVGLARHDERIKSTDKRLDDHVKDGTVHNHRRDGDPTGYFHSFGGG
jgi:hypothetical protein